jgi:hypothetical protein
VRRIRNGVRRIGKCKVNRKVIMINFVGNVGLVWGSPSFWSFFVSNRKYMGEMRM